MLAQLQQARILSIDAMRGITILVMIWVNQMAGVQNISPWWKHMPADADAMTFVDVVFPAFLFIVGMAIPFAINNRLLKGDSYWRLWSHILSRTLALILLGVFMVNAEMGGDPQQMPLATGDWLFLVFVCAILVWNAYPASMSRVLIRGLRAAGAVGLLCLAWIYTGPDGRAMQPHWWGILGLIGWAYLYSCIIYLASRGALIGAAVAVFLCSGFYMAVNSSYWPDGGVWNLLGSQAGHAAHVSITMSGVLVALLMFGGGERIRQSVRLGVTLGYLLVCLALGFLLRPYYPISKIYATPSWCFFSVAACTAVYLTLYYLMDIKGFTRIFGFLKPAAANPLLIYILPYLVFNIAQWLGIPIMPEFAASGAMGIAYTAVYALAMVWVVKWFNRAHIRLQL